MRFLVDASLSPSVVGSLNHEGHDAVHVGDVLPLSAPDDVVFDALEDGAIVVFQETRLRVRPLPLGGSEGG